VIVLEVIYENPVPVFMKPVHHTNMQHTQIWWMRRTD